MIIGSIDIFEERKQMCTFIWITKNHLLTEGSSKYMFGIHVQLFSTVLTMFYRFIQYHVDVMCVWHHGWCNTSPLVLFERACHAFSITVSLNWRDLKQKIVQSSVSPVRCWKLSHYRKGVLRRGGKNNVWGKPPLKMDLSGQGGGKTHTKTWCSSRQQ